MHPSSFQSLLAWQAARKLAAHLYDLTKSFPSDEKYVLVRQMRRAAHSVHANIAEGRGRLSNGEWQQFLGQSRGSLFEIHSFIIVASDLGYCSNESREQTIKLIEDACRFVNGLLRSTRRKIDKKYKPTQIAPDP